VFVRVWQFRVASERAEEFCRVYGPGGDWAALFAREIGFLGTELLQSATHPNIYLTIDSWDSEGAWAAFLRAWGDEYAELDRSSGELTIAEGEIGSYLSPGVLIRKRGGH
jgi:heme-degrading monooxygenase HmoA